MQAFSRQAAHLGPALLPLLCLQHIAYLPNDPLLHAEDSIQHSSMHAAGTNLYSS
jgi:hypothetical protein